MTTKASDPRLKPLEEQLVEAFVEARPGERYLHGGAKDSQALKRLLAAAEPAEILRRWRLALAATGFTRCSSFAELAMPAKWGSFSSSSSAAPGRPDYTDPSQYVDAPLRSLP